MTKQTSFLPEPKNHALLEHKAKLRRKAERRRLLAEPCDIGLFGSDHLQADLVELAKSATSDPPAGRTPRKSSPTPDPTGSAPRRAR
jgi:hypothetical protein